MGRGEAGGGAVRKKGRTKREKEKRGDGGSGRTFPALSLQSSRYTSPGNTVVWRAFPWAMSQQL